MNKKFIITMCICFCAIAALGSSSFYIRTDSTKQGGAKVVGVEQGTEKEIPGNVIVNSANNEVEKEETTSKQFGDRIGENEEQASSFAGNMVHVSGNVEKETETEVETTTSADGYLGHLSEAANNVIKKLEFGEESTLLWPVEGNVLLEYNMDNTIYFPTLNEYRTNDSLIIQTRKDAPIIASTKGVITDISKDEKTGIFVKMAIGNNYEIKYSQVINPVVEVGDVVEPGDTIASVNEPTRFFSKEGANLNMSMKKDGKPVDPMNYLIVNE